MLLASDGTLTNVETNFDLGSGDGYDIFSPSSGNYLIVSGGAVRTTSPRTISVYANEAQGIGYRPRWFGEVTIR